MTTQLSHYWHLFIPKLFICLREGYSLSILRKDIPAGLAVAIISFPLAMALAIASGVSPERGLYTAIVGGFLGVVDIKLEYQPGPLWSLSLASSNNMIVMGFA